MSMPYGHKYEKKVDVIKQLGYHGLVAVACESVGISKSTFWRWCDNDPEFEQRCVNAIASAVAYKPDLLRAVPWQKRNKLLSNALNWYEAKLKREAAETGQTVAA